MLQPLNLKQTSGKLKSKTITHQAEIESLHTSGRYQAALKGTTSGCFVNTLLTKVL